MTICKNNWLIAVAVGLALLVGCGDQAPPASSSSSDSSSFSQSSSSEGVPADETVVELTHNADELAQFKALQAEVEQASKVNAAQLLEQNKIQFLETLSYTPTNSDDLPLIQESPLALSQEL